MRVISLAAFAWCCAQYFLMSSHRLSPCERCLKTRFCKFTYHNSHALGVIALIYIIIAQSLVLIVLPAFLVPFAKAAPVAAPLTLPETWSK